jgi:hypothetical protein
VEIPATVENQIVASFAESLRTAARERLPSPAELSPRAPYERVLLAIIQLASGDIDKAAQLADVARADWRDVLYWAGQSFRTDEPQSWDELKNRLGLPEK